MAVAEKIKIPTDSSIVVVPFSAGPDNLRFALNVHKIMKVVDLESYDRLPADFSPFIGVMNIDSMPVPICDLDIVFASNPTLSTDQSLPLGRKSGQRRVIVCVFQNVHLGILVNKTGKLEQ